jgi:hypothetical protein
MIKMDCLVAGVAQKVVGAVLVIFFFSVQFAKSSANGKQGSIT